ncbi:MAG TPA: tetratricopeptide repeat protein [Burkholderiales bacterium]|nr:tetratricopeptide repeat protein [Burkholderiales bacterium]
MRSGIHLLLALLLAVLFPALALAQSSDPDDDDDDDAPPPAEEPARPAAKLPQQDLSEQLLYSILLGEIAAQRGSPAAAAQTYLDLARQTRDPRIARRAVELATFARTPEVALDAARVWHESDPESPQGLRTVTVLLVNAKRVDDAAPYIAKLLEGKDQAAGGFMQLGQLLGQNTDKGANLRVVKKLAEPYPQVAEAHFAIAQAALAANDESLALLELTRAASIRPGWDLTAIFEAQILRRRSPGEAIERLGAFLDKYPTARDVRMNYARLLVGEKRYPEARTQFEKLLSLHKDDGEAIYGVGLLALQAKDYATAESNLTRLLEIGFRDPNGLRFTLAQVAEEQKDWPRAIGWYDSIKRGEHAIPARMRTANALAKQGKLDEARRYLQAVNAGDGERVQLQIAEAQLLREAQRHRDAFDLLGKALESNPKQPDLMYDYALTAEKLNRVDLLESNLRELIELKPDHAHAYNALGYSLADRNERLAEARKLIEKALELAPEDYYIMDSMGWVLYRMGDLKGAAQQLRRAWQGRPDGEIGAHLGEVLWVLGERAEAEGVWREALEASPESDTLQKTIQRLRK